jgi:hypothetical protein
MIQYSREAQFARAQLLRMYNDLLVFVEDASCQNMHVRVLSRIVEGAGRISHVFPLYGRSNVIEAALNDDGKDPRRVYLIDGDLDLLTGRSVPECDRLHRLSAYSLENFLLTEDALREIATECSHNADATTLDSRLDYSRNLALILRCFLPLFEYYAVVARLNLAIPTVSYSVMRLVKSNHSEFRISASAIAERMKEVRRLIVSAVGWSIFLEELARIRSVSRQLEDRTSAISGKDCLLVLAHAYLRTALQLRDSFNGFRVRLAARFDPGRAPGYRDFVLSALQSNFRLQQ